MKLAVLGYQASQLGPLWPRQAATIETGTVTKMIFKTIDSEYQQALSTSLGEEAKTETHSHSSTGRSHSGEYPARFEQAQGS